MTATGKQQLAITFKQRSLLRPWRVERITQKHDGRRWVVVSRERI